MAKQTLNTIRNWFKTGLKPTQTHFWDTWDSFFHKDDVIPSSSIENLDNRFNSKADKQAFDGHLTDNQAHKALFDGKADKAHTHGIADVTGLQEILNNIPGNLNAGIGIMINGDVISQIFQFSQFQLFKAQGNELPSVETGDIARGFIAPKVFITGIFISGDPAIIDNYTVIDQIDIP